MKKIFMIVIFTILFPLSCNKNVEENNQISDTVSDNNVVKKMKQ